MILGTMSLEDRLTLARDAERFYRYSAEERRRQARRDERIADRFHRDQCDLLRMKAERESEALLQEPS